MHKDKKSLAKIHPEIAKQWHPTENSDLTLYIVFIIDNIFLLLLKKTVL